MTEIRMKECSGHRRATKVRFLDKERESSSKVLTKQFTKHVTIS